MPSTAGASSWRSRSRAGRSTSAITRASPPAGGAGRVSRHPPPPIVTPGRHGACLRRAAAASRPHLPSLYDLSNIFQVNVEEGRQPLAMVYLLRRSLRSRRREERGPPPAALGRRRPQAAHPRRLQREDTGWLSFFMFCFFTDRTGSNQLASLPRSASTRCRPRDASCSPRGAPHVCG